MELYKQKLDLDNVYDINILESGEKQLAQISKERALGLSTHEMELIKKHFAKKKRNPTDVELEAFAQSWSEHCCYKTSKPILKKTIFKVKPPAGKQLIRSDSGAMEFDKKHFYAFKIESHNHPSALDPYGGAATGIGGILRDIVCIGAHPVAFVDPLFFGPLDYPMSNLPQGTKHPAYLFRGVVKGIGDYGNRLGIPTLSGLVYFDEKYVGNCLVNVGCVGVGEKKHMILNKVNKAGDMYILAGGRTGRDGIHGVTFASAELSEKSEEEDRPAVQLGDAITKEPLVHACLEANEKGLLTGFKDLGGGGLSCVVGEMAYAGGHGARVDMDRVPLKEEGMKPWEIWVSESQERMMVTVSPKNVEKVLEIFDFWDVEAVVIGEVIPETKLKVDYRGVRVIELDLKFLLDGVEYSRPYKYVPRKTKDPVLKEPKDYNEFLLRMLESHNLSSREWIIRQYDHEVQAKNVIKPLQGMIFSPTHGDASILKPLEDSNKGLAVTCAANPLKCRQDPYWGSVSVAEECVRNIVSSGGLPDSYSDNLNFGNPEKKDRLADFVKSCEGLYFFANALKLPFVSGNVSFYNESHSGPVPPTPSLVAIGIVEDVKKTVTADLKDPNNEIYLVGETRQELGGSAYYELRGVSGGIVSKTDPMVTKKTMLNLHASMTKGHLRSCHDCAEGGLLLALSEMSFGNEVGFEIDLSSLGKMRTDYALFSESDTRWLVEVEPKHAAAFEKQNKSAKKIGRTKTMGRMVVTQKGETVLDLPVEEAKNTWKNSLHRVLEG